MRQQEAARRREVLRRRRAALATGAAIGATALFAPSAMAADFTVDNTRDAAPAGACDPAIADDCTLRDAIELANTNAEDDQILFESTVTGTIRLTEGELLHNSSYKLNIQGPGAETLAVSGDANNDGAPDPGDSRILNLSSGEVTISDLTLTQGYASYNGSQGGAIVAFSGLQIVDSVLTDNTASSYGGAIDASAELTVQSSELSDNVASGGTGGAVNAHPSGGSTTISDSTLSGNSAQTSGGGLRTSGPMILDNTDVTANEALSGTGGGVSAVSTLEIVDSKLSGNTAGGTGGGVYASSTLEIGDSEVSGNTAGTNGGGVSARSRLTVSDTAVTGNQAPTGQGGGIASFGDLAFVEISDSTISGNSAVGGGGLDLNHTYDDKYSPNVSDISATTISGNTATSDGGGLQVRYLRPKDQLDIQGTTISANTAGASGAGGAIAAPGATYGTIRGEVLVTDSTLSSNSAGSGAGVALGSESGARVVGNIGSIEFENSTVAANTASTRGGGFFLGDYGSPDGQESPTVALTSTIVGDNTASGAAQDLDWADASTGGGFDLAFSLVEAPGDAGFTQTPEGSSIIGVDPQLGGLADNGGSTLTHLPATTSPVVDKGKARARVIIDQRDLDRTVDGEGVPNAPRGDGTDIGAVEVQNPPAKQPDPPPEEPPVVPPTPPADKRPRAFIEHNYLNDFRANRRELLGTATDDNGVVGVQVSIMRKRAGGCTSLQDSGGFSARHSCSRPKFIAADGTIDWRFKLKRKLPTGSYIVYSRAIDDKGKVQTSFGPRSVRLFQIRARKR